MMALSEAFEWRRTGAALTALENLLRCSVCSTLNAHVGRAGACEHLVCDRCATHGDNCDEGGGVRRCCGICGAAGEPPPSPGCQTDASLATLVNGCRQLRVMLRLCSDNESGKNSSSNNNASDDCGERIPNVPPPAQLVNHVRRLSQPPSTVGANEQKSSSAKPAILSVANSPAPSEPHKARTNKRQKVSDDGCDVTPIDTAAGTASAAAASAAAKLNKKNAKGETRLHVAAARGACERVDELLAVGARPNVADHAGWTPLHEACDAGRVDVVQRLLAAGALVDVPGGEHRTPLHDAVSAGRHQVAALLVAAGADTHARSLYDQTPRQLAHEDDEQMLAALNTPRDATHTHDAQRQDEAAMEESAYLPVTVVGDALSAADTALLKAVARKYSWKVKTEVCLGVTHLVVGGEAGADETNATACRERLSCLRALQLGCFVADIAWLHECRRSTAALPPLPQRHLLGAAGRRSVSRVRRLRPPLFAGLHVYLQGDFGSGGGGVSDGGGLTRQCLSQLLQLGGAVLLSRPPNPESIPSGEHTVPYHAATDSHLRHVSHVVVYQHAPTMRYDMAHVKSLSLSWLLDALRSYTLS